MSIKEQINNALKDAMRARDKKTLDTLRLVTAAIKQVEVDERIEVDDTRMLVILNKLAKQRNESISQFQAAKRDDLVEQEVFELAIIKQYLPEPLSESDIEAHIEQAIQATGAQAMSDMGKVMTELKPHLEGRADMSQVSLMVKTRLAR